MVAVALDVLGALALLLGLLLATIGLYGMLRKPSVFEQLHAAGMVTGPALILVLLASIATDAEIITSAVLVILFVLVTSPLSGHAIAQAAWRRDRAERVEHEVG